MDEKEWRTCRFTVNGLVHKVQFNQATIDNLFLPFLRRMTKLQQAAKQRIVVYLAAPPGVGKSTLALMMEKLSLTSDGLVPVQSLALDGFHYDSDYIRKHTVERDGRQIPMNAVKGCPETFNVEHLLEKLQQIKTMDVRWPIYDRNIHDVVEEIVTVRRPIVLLEGNWLLLGEDRWQRVRSFADYSLVITADPLALKDRLIRRRMSGGVSRAAAEQFYQQSDRVNIERVLRRSWPADETWQLLPDMDYQLKGKIMPTKLVDRVALWQKPNVVIDNSLLGGVNRRLSADGAENTLYENGYAEGLSMARRSILRKLYQSGTMSSKAIMDTFRLSAEELADILRK